MVNSGKHLLVMVLALLAGPVAAQQIADDDNGARVIAVVNGDELTRDEFVSFVNVRIGEQPGNIRINQQQLSILLSEYINRELIYQDAIEQGWDKAPEVATAIDNQRRNIIASYVLRRMIEQPINDDDLERAYEKLMAKPVREYRTGHILVDSEQRAKEIISALDRGEAFATLAREHSMDSTADQGGKLGWLSSEQMAEPLRNAMVELKKDSYSRAPVQSDFGWHVLRLEDTRIIPPPPFEDVREELIRRLHNRNISAYIAELRSNSQIEIK